MRSVLRVVVAVLFGTWCMYQVAGCDRGVDPGDIVLDDPICDSLDITFLDSMVLIKQPILVGRRMVFTTQVIYMGSSQSNIVYNLERDTVEATLPPSYFDYNNGEVLLARSETVYKYKIESQEMEKVVSGFYWPTYSCDENHINIRNASGTHKYDLLSGTIVYSIPRYDAREYASGMYVYYDDGFWIYSADAQVSEKLDIDGYPRRGGQLRIIDWDVLRSDRKIVVHSKSVIVGDSSGGLYEVDLESRSADRILKETDGDYTPQYVDDSKIFLVRACQPKHECYVIEYDRIRRKEKIKLTVRFVSEMDVRYET